MCVCMHAHVHKKGQKECTPTLKNSYIHKMGLFSGESFFRPSSLCISILCSLDFVNVFLLAGVISKAFFQFHLHYFPWEPSSFFL